jgi:hypothetical protein
MRNKLYKVSLVVEFKHGSNMFKACIINIIIIINIILVDGRFGPGTTQVTINGNEISNSQDVMSIELKWFTSIFH